MKKNFIILLMCVALLFSLNNLYSAVPTLESNASMSKMLKNILPAVVNVTVRGELPALPPQVNATQPNAQPQHGPQAGINNFESTGSGVVVDAKNGYIVTNAHVIRYAKVLIITLSDGRMLKARIIGIDPATDIAVIQVNDKYLQGIPLADSSHIEPGDFVAAIGSPFGLHQTVTSGVVSALNRSLGIEGPNGYENFIQTDASINPGNSGGALVDMKGNLIGINTAILAPRGGNIGIGFAIPSNMVKTIMQQLIQFGEVKRGVLGVMVQTLTPDLADAFNAPNTVGALVTHLQENSPAATAGVKEKDIILSINDTQVKNAAQLRSMIGLMGVGTSAKMKIKRGSKNLTLTAVIENLDKLKKQKEMASTKNPLNGMRLNDISQLDENHQPLKGVIVLNVNDNSDAWLSGIQPGDVITKANDTVINGLDDLTKIANTNPKQLLLTINRGGATLYMVIS